MSNDNNNRVLNRMGAHQLTQEEIEKINGGIIATRLSDILTGPTSNPDHHIDT